MHQIGLYFPFGSAARGETTGLRFFRFFILPPAGSAPGGAAASAGASVLAVLWPSGSLVAALRFIPQPRSYKAEATRDHNGEQAELISELNRL